MKIFHKNSQKGFALIAAIMALMILMAVGVLVFSVTNQDIRVSSRIVGEKKAFSSAEAGIHELMRNFDPGNLSLAAASNQPVDSNYPSSKYSITTPGAPLTGPAALPISGFNSRQGEVWGQLRYAATVTGRNADYNSQVDIDVGVGYGPVDISTIYR